MHLSARLGLTAALAVSAVVLGTWAPAAAAAPRPGVQVSADGQAFADEITTPLFSGLPVVVPGDRVVRTLWVRNGGTEPGVLRLSGTDAWSTDAEFARDLLVSADPEGSGSGETVVLDDVEACALLLIGPVLAPGETIPIEIAVAFSSETPARDGARQSAGLDFVAALRDPADGASSGADCSGGTVVPGLPEGPGSGSSDDGGRPGAIASTGFAPVMLTMVGAVVVVVGIGVLVLVQVRRREARGEQPPEERR